MVKVYEQVCHSVAIISMGISGPRDPWPEGPGRYLQKLGTCSVLKALDHMLQALFQPYHLELSDPSLGVRLVLAVESTEVETI